MGENDFVAWLRRRSVRADDSVVQGCGPDDCAHLRLAGRRLVATTDTLLEGVHFAAYAPPAAVGWKAVAVNISDLAASACRPRWLLAGVGLRRRPDGERWARALARGMLACADRYGLTLVGGDTTTGAGPTAITVTALGEPLPGGPVGRSGARPGDVLAVTGRLGGSLAGRHLRPVPRVAEMAKLLALAGRGLHAAMDLSDGLAMDLPRLARENGVGATIRECDLPLSPAARRLARADLAAADRTGDGGGVDAGAVRRRARERALGDGEDFELLTALSPAAWRRVAAEWKESTPITAVGVCTAHPGVIERLGEDGALRPLCGGYEHRLDA